jgi:hypothetical protein
VRSPYFLLNRKFDLLYLLQFTIRFNFAFRDSMSPYPAIKERDAQSDSNPPVLIHHFKIVISPSKSAFRTDPWKYFTAHGTNLTPLCFRPHLCRFHFRTILRSFL